MTKALNGLMIAGMSVSWAIYYAISKVMVAWTGSPALAGLLLRGAALGFLTAQLLADGAFSRLFHQGKAVMTLCLIGVFGFLLDLFANLGYQGGSLAAGTALLKTDVLMVNLVTVALYHRRLYASDWAGTFIVLAGVLLVLGVDLRGVHFQLRDGFFLLSAACVTVNAFLIKSAQDRFHEDADMISYYNNAVVLLLFGVMAAADGAAAAFLVVRRARRTCADGHLFLLLPQPQALRGVGGQALSAAHAHRQRRDRRGVPQRAADADAPRRRRRGAPGCGSHPFKG